MHRFYCTDLDSGTLNPEESHHAAVVLRLQPGDACALFDGRGTEAKAELTAVSKSKVAFHILTRQNAPALNFHLVLGQAIPKGKSMDLILQKATELGLQEIHPIASDRSVVQMDGERQEAKLEKWHQVVLEACKQCGQNRLPRVEPIVKIQDFLDAANSVKALKLIASLQPDARPLHQVLAENRPAIPGDKIIFLVGPEGDFTPAEIGKARSAGYLPVSLGPQVLRTETAALYLISVLSYEMGRA